MADSEEKREKVTIEEIAQALGVSKSTVSRALSGKGRIGEETRKRVYDYIRQAERDARSSPQTRTRAATHNISLVIHTHFARLDLPFLRKCMAGVTRMADQRGYDVLLCYCGRDENSVEQLERQLLGHKMDGVILSRAVVNDPCVAMLETHRVPFIAIGHPEDTAALQIDTAQVGGAGEITRLLLQGGMRRIAYMGGSPAYLVNVDRVSGYRRALEEFGLAAEDALIFNGLETAEQQEDALESVLAQAPDCLLCGDDSLAFNVFQRLRERGVRVLEELRLASLYDSEQLTTVTPAISAVQFDADALGSSACRTLLDSLAGKEVPQRQLLGYQVVLLESTK